jgi:glyoxylase-like metal-dependent hydrolase (beta-lactamase superfamily II)
MSQDAGERVSGIRQWEAWRERVMPPVEELAADLWSIPVPIPDNPLRYVSAYAFASGGGLVLLDSGWDSAESWRALCSGLAAIGAAPADVRGVLVTHMHVDHAGLAGRLRDTSGAWIAMHPADRALISLLRSQGASGAVADEVAFLRSLGAPAAEAAEAVGPVEQYVQYLGMALADRELNDGDLADVPGWQLRAVHTPGHTPGHLCFVDERARRLFAGDHVLPRITPNISLQVGGPADPLRNYLASLERVRDLDADEVLPAHEWRFRGLAARVDSIAVHHERRLAELLAAIDSHPGSTPWQLASLITWSRPWERYSGRIRITAVAETAAHVNELVRRGLVTRISSAVPAYQSVGPRN